MKYIILLLLACLTSWAQQTTPDYNTTKVTAFRLINAKMDGEVNAILRYIKSEKSVGYYIQAAQSTDRDMAYALLKLKREAVSWPAVKQNDTAACTNAHNMFVVQVNQYRDTIYTTNDNFSILIPHTQAQYIDSLKQIDAALTPDLKAFFNRNLQDEYERNKPDSISCDRVLINNKTIYKLTRKSFESKIGRFQVIRTDSVFNPDLNIHREFAINNMKMAFDGDKNRISTLTSHNLNVQFAEVYDFEVDGIKVGDSEEKLYECYPYSTKFRNWGAPLNNISNNYYYDVQLIGGDGFVMFYIKDGIINEIEVVF